MGKYGITPEMLTGGGSHTKIIQGIKTDSVVLEFGPANGVMTEYLCNSLDCDVYIVEYDEEDFNVAMKYAKGGVFGDASKLEWVSKFSHIKFDYIIFSDILEHLYNPSVVLKNAVPLLKNEGRVFISVPNIAHSAIIINLIANKFEYHNIGLLDNTHIRFFTYYSLHEMLDLVGLTAIVEDASYAPPQTTEFGVDYNVLAGNTDVLKGKDFENVYQFVFEAVKKEYYYDNKHELKIKKNIILNFTSALTEKFATLYLDNGNGFNEEEKKVVTVVEGQRFYYQLDTTFDLKYVRFDPIEKSSCIVEKPKFTSNVGYLPYKNLNGYKIGNYYVFLTKAPQFIIEIPEGVTWIAIETEILPNSQPMLMGLFASVKEMKEKFIIENKMLQQALTKDVEKLKIENEMLQQTFAKNVEELKTEILAETKALEKQTLVIENLMTEIQYHNISKEELLLQLKAIQSSTFWRITKPARIFIGGMKWFLRSFPLTRGIYRSFWNMRRSKISKTEDGTNYDDKIIVSVDSFEYINDVLHIDGWAFCPDSKITELHINVVSKKQKSAIPTTYGISRKDVFDAHKDSIKINDEYVGFQASCKIQNFYGFYIELYYVVENRAYSIPLKLKSNSSSGRLSYYLGIIRKYGFNKIINYVKNRGLRQILAQMRAPRIEAIDTDDFGNIDIFKWMQENLVQETLNNNFDFSGEIDIILPVFNGFNYLEPLFASIFQTNLRYNIYIIDDCSTDVRVSVYLKKLALADNIYLIENDINQGFVHSVNKALKLTKNHVALLNSDIELPKLWLERLMYPIIFNSNVASSTPFTNAGTICSFPEIGKDNPLFLGLPLSDIDDVFASIKPAYTNLPTGVGFCMGMNKKAIQEIGFFDEDSFSKGYGEENDWCQRAVKSEYKNVIVENLFVYHKHGGSFLGDEKKSLIEKNSKIISNKHPKYFAEVAEFFTLDPLRHIRNFASMYLCLKQSSKQILFFNHSIGGGATSYLDKRIMLELTKSSTVIVIRYNHVQGTYIFQFQSKYYKFTYQFTNISNLRLIMQWFPCTEIFINELVTYPQINELLKFIVELKEEFKSKLTMLIHDYFSVCPSIQLLNQRFEYCALPDTSVCMNCFENSGYDREFESIKLWRNNWEVFLNSCDEIIAFSNDSKSILENAYSNLNSSITVTPHVVNYIPKLNKRHKTTTQVNIGLMGDLTIHKGAKFIGELLKEIDGKNLNVRIVLIGTNHGSNFSSHNFFETGRYKQYELPTLTLKNDIDIFLVPSICPETFSYTTEEAIKMEMPLSCFNLGAPAERIATYEKGLILDSMDAAEALEQILDFVSEVYFPPREKKVAFVIEYVSFSSRYRVEHLMEQLLFQGISSDIFESHMTEDIANRYDVVVLYRCQITSKINMLIDAMHEKGKNVFYDIDDFIFEYEQISNLIFLLGSDYKGFRDVSIKIKKCMSLCDGFITSTNHMKQAINNSFPNKPVYINRNSVSLEMLTASLLAKDMASKDKEKVVLGYFSGSKTHNADFQVIEPAICNLLEAHENLFLKIVGILDIGDTLEKYSNRIERVGFIPWQQMQKELATIDINLMPLEDSFFNWCKSENKWTEAALVGVPTVCSYNPELAIIVDNGINGFLCKTLHEWENVLKSLIANSELRYHIGMAANKFVIDNKLTFVEQGTVKAIFE